MTLLLSLFLSGLIPAGAGAQDPSATVERASPPPDSSELLRRARRAQRAFESRHRAELYPTGEDWRAGGCDEQIGRICLRFEGGEDWEPVEENPEIAEAREELLAVLAEVAESLPGNRWLLGQRIRYLGDLGRWEEAERLAGSCSGPPAWWCHGLLGYVQHRGGRPAEAMIAFDSALALMDRDQSREWTDPSVLLGYAEERWLANPGELSRGEARERFWRLADPLYLTPGNERLTEHLSRWFGASLYEDASTTMGLGWGRAFQEILVRYGFVAGWERTRPRVGTTASGSVVEHHHPDSRGLLPPFEALEDPGGLPEGVWVPEDEAPVSASAPVRAPFIAQGIGQSAVFRRGDRLYVVAAYGPPADTLLHRRRPAPSADVQEGDEEWSIGRPPPWEPPAENLSRDTLSGLFLLPVGGNWAPLGSLGRGGEGVLEVEAPPGEYLLSLELWNPAGRWGARIRHGISAGTVPPDVPTLSDLILTTRGDSFPATLEKALEGMLTRPALRSGQKVTVAWEIYGLGRRREPMSFSISLVEEEPGLIRRALNRIGLLRRPPPLSVDWTEGGVESVGPLFRAVDIEIPSLKPGRYLLRLEMELPYRSKVLSGRRITVF